MWLQISSGKGPCECELSAKLFLDILIKDCKKENIKISVLKYTPGDKKGNFKSLLLSVVKWVSFFI